AHASIVTTPVSQCNAGDVQCCNSVQSSSSAGAVTSFLVLLGIVLGDVAGLIGLACSPISLIGLNTGVMHQS
ncbi:hypothetical protein SERLADRAFT_350261, partial [Serpula lacrymans var. lacrymans S7.9]